MDAPSLTHALGGKWLGNRGMARCPAHPDRTPSLSIAEGDSAEVVLKCFAGCDQDAVFDALERLDLWRGHSATAATSHMAPCRRRQTDSGKNRTLAKQIWHDAQPIGGTPGEQYFRARGIQIDLPPSLRFNSALAYQPAGVTFPGVVGCIQNDHELLAVHRTYLAMDATKKAPVSSPRMMLGALEAGAVRLAPAERALGICEGIEDGLSAMQLFEIPVWCALSANRLGTIAVPPSVIEIQIFGDNDGPGKQEAARAVETYTKQGKRVALRLPPERYKDWNEAAQAGARR